MTDTRPDPRRPLGERIGALAEQARRLPPPDHRNPERFHIARFELAAELRRLAAEAGRAAA